MKNLSTLSVILFFSVIINTFALETLGPDPKYKRPAKVMAHRILVRLNTTFGLEAQTKENYKLALNAQIVRPMLDITRSLTFNERRRKAIALTNPGSIDAIIAAEAPLLRTFVVRFDEDMAPETYCKMLKECDNRVELAEPYYIYKTQWKPSDPLFTQQNSMTDRLQLEAAWDICKGDSNTVIAISDNGVDQLHPDLAGNIYHNWNDTIDGADNDNNGCPDDFIGYNMAWEDEGSQPWNTYHGTDHGICVAGIAAAHTDNDFGMAGVAGKCRFFPIKVSLKADVDDVTYGYESIKYAADNGFKVLNLSWGLEKSPSSIEASIINYAIARDVAIVASGGNEDYSRVPNYPAAYPGVLGVGEVDMSDKHTASAIGAHVDIMAPGTGLYYPTSNDGFDNIWSGTSFASPVVAGVVALVRSHYPELNAMQSLELVRQSTDDISMANQTIQNIIPGRINAYKALSTPPMSIPGIRPGEITFIVDGERKARFLFGETATMSINAFNHLGQADNLRFVLSVQDDDHGLVNIINNEVTMNHIDANSALKIEGFTLELNENRKEPMILRVDIYADGDYHDFFMVRYLTVTETTIFSNDIISFCASDRGTIGFGGEYGMREAYGFIYGNYGNQLWKSALIINDNGSGTSLCSANWDSEDDGYNPFKALRLFGMPDTYRTGLNDDLAPDTGRIGVEVEQNYYIPKGDTSVVCVDIKLTNKSGKRLTAPSIGYYFDWDVAWVYDKNSVELFLDPFPSDMQTIAAAGELASFEQDYPVVGGVVFSDEPDAVGQCAGINNSGSPIYEAPYRLQYLSSGRQVQHTSVTDISMVLGMQFTGALDDGDSRVFTMIFGAAETKAELAQYIKSMLIIRPAVNDAPATPDLSVYPMPARGSFSVSGLETGPVQFTLYTLQGIAVSSFSKNIPESGTTTISTNGISQGCYILKATDITGMDRTVPLIVGK